MITITDILTIPVIQVSITTIINIDPAHQVPGPVGDIMAENTGDILVADPEADPAADRADIREVDQGECRVEDPVEFQGVDPGAVRVADRAEVLVEDPVEVLVADLAVGVKQKMKSLI